MSLDFLVWLLVFFIQLGLLGITMYIVSSSVIQMLHSAHPCLPTSSWALVLLINSNIALVLQLITLSDLEADYLNPHDSSVIVNYWLVRGLPCSFRLIPYAVQPSQQALPASLRRQCASCGQQRLLFLMACTGWKSGSAH